MEEKWIVYRGGATCGVFDNRKEAIKWLKAMLKQTLKDFDKQDKTNEYNYQILLHEIVIEPIKQRDSSLGL